MIDKFTLSWIFMSEPILRIPYIENFHNILTGYKILSSLNKINVDL